MEVSLLTRPLRNSINNDTVDEILFVEAGNDFVDTLLNIMH